MPRVARYGEEKSVFGKRGVDGPARQSVFVRDTRADGGAVRVDRLDVGSRYGGLRVCGAAAFGRRRRFPFYQLGIGATMELGRSGRPMMPHDADIGFAWSGRRRSSAAGYGVDMRNAPIATALI